MFDRVVKFLVAASVWASIPSGCLLAPGCSHNIAEWGIDYGTHLKFVTKRIPDSDRKDAFVDIDPLMSYFLDENPGTGDPAPDDGSGEGS